MMVLIFLILIPGLDRLLFEQFSHALFVIYLLQEKSVGFLDRMQEKDVQSVFVNLQLSPLGKSLSSLASTAMTGNLGTYNCTTKNVLKQRMEQLQLNVMRLKNRMVQDTPSFQGFPTLMLCVIML